MPWIWLGCASKCWAMEATGNAIAALITTLSEKVQCDIACGEE
jgi:hypothetical protein